MENEPIRFVTPRMLDAILQKLENPMDRAMLLLASEGLRTEEIVKLKIDDIDAKNKLIKIQNEKNVCCIPVCQTTIEQCIAAHEQRTYRSLATAVNVKPKKIIDSEYIIRPIDSEQCLPHMVKRGTDYRIKNIFSSQNIGITIVGGLESIRIGGILYKLHSFNGGKKEFNNFVIFIYNKFYYKTSCTTNEIETHIIRLYRKYSIEFKSILNDEDVIVDKILSTTMHKAHETVRTVTEQLVTSTNLQKLPIDKAAEYYLWSIKQKVSSRSLQSVEKMIAQLTKWSNNNNVSVSNFTKNDAVEFIVSLKPKARAEVERRISTIGNFFKYLCATGNAAQNPFENLDVEEVWEAKNRLKKK